MRSGCPSAGCRPSRSRSPCRGASLAWCCTARHPPRTRTRTPLGRRGGARSRSRPGPERLVWAWVARSVRSDAGLRRMVAPLSTRPLDQWWSTWTPKDRARARDLFRSMRSGSGFVNDLRQGRPDRAAVRRLVQGRVGCPTLVTASRDDAGVAFRHAEDLAGAVRTRRSSSSTHPAICSGSVPAALRLNGSSGSSSPQRRGETVGAMTDARR